MNLNSKKNIDIIINYDYLFFTCLIIILFKLIKIIINKNFISLDLN